MRAAIARGFPPTARPGAWARFGFALCDFFHSENFSAVCAQSPAPSCKRPTAAQFWEGGIVFWRSASPFGVKRRVARSCMLSCAAAERLTRFHMQ